MIRAKGLTEQSLRTTSPPKNESSGCAGVHNCLNA